MVIRIHFDFLSSGVHYLLYCYLFPCISIYHCIYSSTDTLFYPVLLCSLIHCIVQGYCIYFYPMVHHVIASTFLYSFVLLRLFVIAYAFARYYPVLLPLFLLGITMCYCLYFYSVLPCVIASTSTCH